MQISSAPQSGSLSSLPRIHGLGLWQPGHVGVYVGGGMAVDCRDTSSNTVYSSVYSHNCRSGTKFPVSPIPRPAGSPSTAVHIIMRTASMW